MESVLQIKYEGHLYPDFSFIRIPDQLVGPKKVFKMQVINDTFYSVKDAKFLTNMEKGEYEIRFPKAIAKFSSEPMTLTLNTEKLFESTNKNLFDPTTQKHQIMVALDYTRVREFEV